MATYDENGFIVQLDEDEVFVFGSNLAGRHGAGAALQAKRQFGANYLQGEGLQGQSYAFPTLDKELKKLGGFEIMVSISNLADAAIDNPGLTFLMTKVGAGLAGYTEEEMIDFFKKFNELIPLPTNIQFPVDWHDQIFN